MAAEPVRVESDAFAALADLAASASAQVAAAQLAADARCAARHADHRGAVALAAAAVASVIAAVLLVPGMVARHPLDHAGVAVLAAAQRPADRLQAEDVARLAVDPTSTRLLVVTDDGSHYVARTPSGELCLIRVPAGEVPTEVCVPDRVGADATIGEVGPGQVRLVADGAPRPSPFDGWVTAGPNVWIRG